MHIYYIIHCIISTGPSGEKGERGKRGPKGIIQYIILLLHTFLLFILPYTIFNIGFFNIFYQISIIFNYIFIF